MTSLSLCMLLKTQSAWVSALAAATAISSKFVFRVESKHFFNPANFGLIIAFLTGEAWLSPGQWGSAYALLFLFCATGLMVVGRIGRIETTGGFLLTYLGLEAVRQLWWLGWELDVWTHKLTNGALLLFAFFMITDPRSIPNHPWVRFVWATAIGVVSFIVVNFYYKYSAFVWTLFFFSPLTPVLDRLFPARTFAWSR
ncbi:MAG: RnfABCDGE type electron transport complex subunit D [Bacteroidia bacterium]|nr:RnfABCDGE type electron transport complex subunit D [Bacteroidia bacterium]